MLEGEAGFTALTCRVAGRDSTSWGASPGINTVIPPPINMRTRKSGDPTIPSIAWQLRAHADARAANDLDWLIEATLASLQRAGPDDGHFLDALAPGSSHVARARGKAEARAEQADVEDREAGDGQISMVERELYCLLDSLQTLIGHYRASAATSIELASEARARGRPRKQHADESALTARMEGRSKPPAAKVRPPGRPRKVPVQDDELARRLNEGLAQGLEDDDVLSEIVAELLPSLHTEGLQHLDRVRTLRLHVKRLRLLGRVKPVRK